MSLPLIELASLCQTKVVDNPSCTQGERERALKLIERFALLSTTGRRDYHAELKAENQKEVLRGEMADFLSLR